MKNRYIILGLFIAFSLSVFAAPAPQRKTTRKPRKVERYDTGSFWNVGLGFGVSDLNYSLDGGKVSPLIPSFTVGVEYTYFFKKFFGLGIGVDFANYGANAKLTEPLTWEANNRMFSGSDFNSNLSRDIDGKTVRATDFVYNMEFEEWREWQNTYMLEVPIALHFKHKPKKTGFFVNVGAKLGVPLYSHYVYKKASMLNSAYYPYFDLTLKDIPGRFENEKLGSRQTGKINGFKTLNAIGFTDIGMMFQLDKKVDLTVGAYFNMFITNFNDISETHALGFASDVNHGEMFGMAKYDGLIGTDKVSSSMHPWNVGLKVGVSIYQGLTEKQKKAKVKKFMKQYKDYMPKPDTVFVHTVTRDTIFVHDTLVHQAVKSQVFHDTIFVARDIQTKQEMKLDQILQTSVIWFNFDEYIPILEPSYILDSVADMLLEYPDLEISVNGHACKIGTDSYNKKLAQKRAQAVANMLKKLGVPEDQMHINSYGANHPFRYQGEHQLEKDRRVEIIPYKKKTE